MLFYVPRQKSKTNTKEHLNFAMTPKYITATRETNTCSDKGMQSETERDQITDSMVVGTDIESWKLGPADVGFAKRRHPNIMELLVHVQCQLDPGRFALALGKALVDFPQIGGRRASGEGIILGGSGVQLSAIHVADQVFLTKPLAGCLFDPPGDCTGTDSGAHLLTLRIASSSESSTLAVCFDHALCDMAGVGLLLAHLSSHYVGHPLPPAPCHDRGRQEFISNAAGQRDILADASGRTDQSIGQRWKKVEGGCVYVRWTYTSEELLTLKARFSARSSHEAVFVDVVQLLHSAGHAPLVTVSISRNDRRRAGMPAEHFGNGTAFIEAVLPPLPASPEAVAIALRAAVDSEPTIVSTRAGADMHISSWWHALQHPLSFGGDPNLTTFSVGPGTLASAIGRSTMSGGQPVLTILPAAHRGLDLLLLVPLGLARNIVKILKMRAKKVND